MTNCDLVWGNTPGGVCKMRDIATPDISQDIILANNNRFRYGIISFRIKILCHWIL